MKTDLEVLQKARQVISNPANWTQRTSAVNALGEMVGVKSTEACAWCAVGAVYKAMDAYSGTVWNPLEGALPAGYNIVSEYNDTHSHEEVLALFDRAIEIAKGEDHE